MKILVCGGRDFGDLTPIPYVDGHRDHTHPLWDERRHQYTFVHRTLDALARAYSVEYSCHDNWLPSDIEIVSGGASGADSAAEDWAVLNWTKYSVFKADWGKHGKAAGPIRNQQMLDEGKPDLVIAFEGGKGTAGMLLLAKRAGIPTVQYSTGTY